MRTYVHVGVAAFTFLAVYSAIGNTSAGFFGGVAVLCFCWFLDELADKIAFRIVKKLDELPREIADPYKIS